MRVSVAMITYNQAAYIAQAIESVLMQKTTFAYELVIGEDCSTDQTRAIVASYAQRYPDRIRPLLHPSNLGGHGKHNFIATTQACQGEYIAVLEGDDFWTAPDKLQKQVDFLERRPAFALCFHNVLKWANDGRPLRDYCTLQQQELTADDLLLRNPIPTCSVMYRQGLVTTIPEWYYTLPMGDWPLWLLLAQQGKIGYLPEVLGTYRVHGQGLWSGQKSIAQLFTVLTTSAVLGAQLGYRPEPLIERGLPIWLARLSQGLAKEMGPTRLQEIAQALESLLAQWPPFLRLSPQQTRWLLGHVYMNLSTAFYKAQNGRAARHCWQQAIQQDRNWLWQRRFWSLALKSSLPVGQPAPQPEHEAKQ